MDTNQITQFDFRGATVRVLTDEQGEPWFVGKDVAKVLGYSDANKAVAMHVDNEDKKLNDKTSSSFGQGVPVHRESPPMHVCPYRGEITRPVRLCKGLKTVTHGSAPMCPCVPVCGACGRAYASPSCTVASRLEAHS